MTLGLKGAGGGGKEGGKRGEGWGAGQEFEGTYIEGGGWGRGRGEKKRLGEGGERENKYKGNNSDFGLEVAEWGGGGGAGE